MDGVTTNYVLDVAGGLTQVLSDGTNTYLYGNGRIGELQPGGFLYHLTDALGSVRQLVDAAGLVELAQRYEPFGSVLDSSGMARSAFAFTGESQDVATNLVYLRARYLSTAQGRFLNTDPSQQEQNLFAYAIDNPILVTDPSGLKHFWLWDDFKGMAAERHIRIDQEPIRKKEIDEIIRNFDGNPYSDSEQAMLGVPGDHQPTDVHRYDNLSPDVRQLVECRTGERNLPVNLNSWDWLFSGWADYWAWRVSYRNGATILPLDYPVTYPPLARVPDMLKAIALRESFMGWNRKYPVVRDDISLLNVTDWSGYYQMVSLSDNVSYYQKYFDMNWGLMGVSFADRYNPILEVGIATRSFYAEYFNTALRLGATLKGKSEEEIWQSILTDYGEKGKEACYGCTTWRLATTGILSIYTCGFGGTADLWGQYQ